VRLILTQPVLGHAPNADNMNVIRSCLDGERLEITHSDLLLLPERFHLEPSRERYERDVSELARDYGCHVVGGSHHEQRDGIAVNSGVVVDPGGNVIGRYEKLRPYATERLLVKSGKNLGEIVIAGRRVLVVVCADFWFSDVFERSAELPDLVVVPALSVTRKPSPEYSRELWRHLAIARAYELGTYVGISDWAPASQLPFLSASGVGGFADPTTSDPDAFFHPLGERSVVAFPLDFAAQQAFRQDRMARGFFWRTPRV
jgi:predicted amidohydrolase